MINYIKNGVISGKIAKIIFEEMFVSGNDPEQIIKDKNLQQLSDPKKIATIINQILEENEKFVIEYKNGKEKLFGFFVGQIMKKTSGKASPEMVNNILKEKLK